MYLENRHGSGKFNIYVFGVLDMGQEIPYLFIWRNRHGSENFISMYLE